MTNEPWRIRQTRNCGENAARAWVAKLRGQRCGPSFNDDANTAAATELCLPSNQDTFRYDLGRISRSFGARVLLEAKNLGVAIVKSGGNDNDTFCADAGGELRKA